MADVIPKAGFADPLIKERGARRMAHVKAVLTNPYVIVVMIAAVGLALIQPLYVLLVWVIVIVGAFAYADHRAKREWWLSLLDYLGLEPVTSKSVLPLTPLLRSGDRREVLRGGADARRALLIFRSTDVRRDSDGDEHRTNHDYTVVLIRREQAAIRFLSAHEHRVSFMKFLGDDLRGKTLRGVEEFKTESLDLHERFELRSSTEDGTRARQVFQPSFILWFARKGVPFEYEGGDLVVFTDRVLQHAEEFKVLLSRADEIDAAIHGKAP